MNPFSNSDIMPESKSSIVEEPAYHIEKFLVDEVFWTRWGDDDVIRDFEMLGEFDNQAATFECYNKHRNGLRDIRITAIRRYPDGHVEYARIGGIA